MSSGSLIAADPAVHSILQVEVVAPILVAANPPESDPKPSLEDGAVSGLRLVGKNDPKARRFDKHLGRCKEKVGSGELNLLT